MCISLGSTGEEGCYTTEGAEGVGRSHGNTEGIRRGSGRERQSKQRTRGMLHAKHRCAVMQGYGIVIEVLNRMLSLCLSHAIQGDCDRLNYRIQELESALGEKSELIAKLEGQHKKDVESCQQEKVKPYVSISVTNMGT